MIDASIRLAKLVAQRFNCSRAEASNYIEGGWIMVDDTVIEESGFRVAPNARIELIAGATALPVEPVTMLLHKPAAVDCQAALHFITAENRDPDDRSKRMLKRHLHELSLLAPLEHDDSGLLVWSQDWRVKRKLTEDAARIEHELIVDVSGNMASDGLARLNHGMTFGGKVISMKVSWQNENRLRFAVKAPPVGLIRHVCAQIGLVAGAVKRIRLGKIAMAGLKPGQWRYLHSHERF